jgi:hypothetical protein
MRDITAVAFTRLSPAEETAGNLGATRDESTCALPSLPPPTLKSGGEPNSPPRSRPSRHDCEVSSSGAGFAPRGQEGTEITENTDWIVEMCGVAERRGWRSQTSPRQLHAHGVSAGGARDVGHRARRHSACLAAAGSRSSGQVLGVRLEKPARSSSITTNGNMIASASSSITSVSPTPLHRST